MGRGPVRHPELSLYLGTYTASRRSFSADRDVAVETLSSLVEAFRDVTR
jgi:hypothetical protein